MLIHHPPKASISALIFGNLIKWYPLQFSLYPHPIFRDEDVRVVAEGRELVYDDEREPDELSQISR